MMLPTRTPDRGDVLSFAGGLVWGSALSIRNHFLALAVGLALTSLVCFYMVAKDTE